MTCFPSFVVVRATASAAIRERQRESGEGMGRYAGEDTHLGEERLRDVDVAQQEEGRGELDDAWGGDSDAMILLRL